MPKAAINYTEISSLICKTILILNERNFQYNLLYVKIADMMGEKMGRKDDLMAAYLWSVVDP